MSEQVSTQASVLYVDGTDENVRRGKYFWESCDCCPDHWWYRYENDAHVCYECWPGTGGTYYTQEEVDRMLDWEQRMW